MTRDDGNQDDNRLGSFLRSRRERIDAASAGVVDNTRRRVKGLRREELALLAGVSPSYYTRIEQGRDRHPSREILEALARVLRLDDTERGYLWSLVAPALVSADGQQSADPVRTVRPGVLVLLERWADLPAFVVGPGRDVLAATALATRVNPAWSAGHNLIEFTFLDPRAREVYPDWDDIAVQAVAGLRTTAAVRPGRLDGFVADMRERSESFRALWDSHEVYDRVTGEKRLAVDGLREDGVGEDGVLTLDFETFALAGPEGHVLYVYFPRPGSKDDAALRGLARRLERGFRPPG
ncbi:MULTISPECIES: helix-turn-helix transcriptional regulator [unclassified Streptomyces]|uniref:helix-turn-helix domain-containing protein n=1 Tax=unclassified Streptomyces TaxID=2593676 RepID=UPI002E18B799|nr:MULTISPECIES: helix-turn-helix transcriptional regulator [unclassified Streptomyces]